jgi:hypothetical protein
MSDNHFGSSLIYRIRQ